MSLGHVSMRDPQGRGFWLKRATLGLGEVQDEDFTLVDFEGNVLGGKGPRHIEWPIHSEILRARPDIDFVGHTHADYVTLMSCLDEDLLPYTHAGVYFFPGPPRFVKTSELIRTPAMGRDLAACLGEADATIIRNHGCAFVGRTAQELCMTGVSLRQACQIHFMLAQTGRKTVWPDPAEAERRQRESGRDRASRLAAPTGTPDNRVDNFWNFFSRKLARYEKSQR